MNNEIEEDSFGSSVPLPSVDFPVLFVGGINEYTPGRGLLRQSWHESWKLVFGPEGVDVKRKPNKMFAVEETVESATWSSLRFVTFEGAETSRRTLISLGREAGTAMFIAYLKAPEARLTVEALLKAYPGASGVLRLGTPAGIATNGPDAHSENVAGQLQTLADLYQAGSLTSDEFDTAKKAILGP